MVRVQKDMEAGRKNTIAVIPSYNEEKTIGGIVRGIVKMGLSALVIDDGSTDDTARVALESGATVKRHRTNHGKGKSVRQGVTYIMNRTGYEWIIIMDGDGQHHTRDIPALMDATLGGDVDIVIGNRMGSTEEMPPVRFWTNRFMSWVLSGLCGQTIPDTQCGYRLLRAGALKKLKLISRNYDIESEMLLQASEKGMKIRSVPIRTIYGEEVSTIKPVRDTLRFARLIFRHYLASNGLRKTKKEDGRGAARSKGNNGPEGA